MTPRLNCFWPSTPFAIAVDQGHGHKLMRLLASGLCHSNCSTMVSLSLTLRGTQLLHSFKLFGSMLIKPQGQEWWGLPSNGHTWKPVWTLCVLHCPADFRNDNELSREEWKRHKTIPRANSGGQHPISQVLMRTTDLALLSIYMRRWKFEETSLQYLNNAWCCTHPLSQKYTAERKNTKWHAAVKVDDHP